MSVCAANQRKTIHPYTATSVYFVFVELFFMAITEMHITEIYFSSFSNYAVGQVHMGGN